MGGRPIPQRSDRGGEVYFWSAKRGGGEMNQVHHAQDMRVEGGESKVEVYLPLIMNDCRYFVLQALSSVCRHRMVSTLVSSTPVPHLVY